MYLFPLHISQVIETSGKKFISNFIEPPPLQASHLPPLTLNEKCPGLYPLSLDNLVSENIKVTRELSQKLTDYLIKNNAQMPLLKETGLQIDWPNSLLKN